MSGASSLAGGRYDWFGWRVSAAPADFSVARLMETHEYAHRQLDDTTAFGGLTTTMASLADAQPEGHWPDLRNHLQDMSDLVHESHAVGLSLLTTQRRLEPIAGYPAYDRHLHTVQRLLGGEVHPWVALAAIRAAATACMQSGALAEAVTQGVEHFDATSLQPAERPNRRLAALLAGGFESSVGRAQSESVERHSGEPWWSPDGDLRLRPEAVDDDAAVALGVLHRRLFDAAAEILNGAGGRTIEPDAHHEELRTLLKQARTLAPEGLTRIGAMVETPGGDLLHGGALDSQTIEMASAPKRAVVLPYGSLSGLGGEGEWRHGFLVVTRPQRIRAAYRLEGVELPEAESVACLRSIVYDEAEPDSVLHVVVERPEQIEEEAPMYVSVLSSAAAADPDGVAAWIRWADPDRVSMVMDTPLTAALQRWCGTGGYFHCDTRAIRFGGQEVRVIAGRVEHDERRSALIVVPSTEFGARWFEAVLEESDLRAVVRKDPEFFEREGIHLDVVLNHMLLEERYVGTGSWRR